MFGAVDDLRVCDGGGDQEQPPVAGTQAPVQVSPGYPPQGITSFHNLNIVTTRKLLAQCTHGIRLIYSSKIIFHLKFSGFLRIQLTD